MTNTIKINLSPSNTALVPLLMIKSEDSYKSYTLAQIEQSSPITAKALRKLYEATGSGELPSDSTVLTVQYKQGCYSKSFGPGIYRDIDKNEIYLDFAGKKIPIVSDKSRGLYIANNNLSIGAIDVNLVYDDIFDNGKDLYLRLALYIEEKDLTIALYALIRRQDIKTEVDLDALISMSKRNFEAFKAIVGPPPSGNTFDGPTVKLSDLQEGSEYQCISYRQVTTDYGTTYIMLLEANPEGGLPVRSECWSNSDLKKVMAAKPIATEENPMILSVVSIQTKTNKSGKTSNIVNAYLQPTAYELTTNDELDIDF